MDPTIRQASGWVYRSTNQQVQPTRCLLPGGADCMRAGAWAGAVRPQDGGVGLQASSRGGRGPATVEFAPNRCGGVGGSLDPQRGCDRAVVAEAPATQLRSALGAAGCHRQPQFPFSPETPTGLLGQAGDGLWGISAGACRPWPRLVTGGQCLPLHETRGPDGGLQADPAHAVVGMVGLVHTSPGDGPGLEGAGGDTTGLAGSAAVETGRTTSPARPPQDSYCVAGSLSITSEAGSMDGSRFRPPRTDFLGLECRVQGLAGA